MESPLLMKEGVGGGSVTRCIPSLRRRGLGEVQSHAASPPYEGRGWGRFSHTLHPLLTKEGVGGGSVTRCIPSLRRRGLGEVQSHAASPPYEGGGWGRFSHRRP